MVAFCNKREFGENPKQLTSTVKATKHSQSHWETGKTEWNRLEALSQETCHMGVTSLSVRKVCYQNL